MLYELDKTAEDRFVEKDTKAIGKAMIETAESYEPEHARIKIPVLSFFALEENLVFPDYLTEEQKAAALEYSQKVWLRGKTKISEISEPTSLTRGSSKFRMDIITASWHMRNWSTRKCGSFCWNESKGDPYRPPFL